MRARLRLVPTAIVMLVAVATPLAAVEPKDLVAIPQSAQTALVERGVPVTFKAAGFFLAEWSEGQQAGLRKQGIPFEMVLRDVRDDRTLFLFELDEGEKPPSAWTVLYRSGRSVVVAMDDAEAQTWALKGEHPIRLWHEAHGWGRPASELATYDCSYNPLVAEILGKTTQAQWLDWVDKLSGAKAVDIGGASYTIDTRYTSRMFSGASNAKGFDFVRQQGEAWGFAGARLGEDPFTTGIHGKNRGPTLPGQTSSEVLLTRQPGTIWQYGDSTVAAPGANDNGTGSTGDSRRW